MIQLKIWILVLFTAYVQAYVIKGNGSFPIYGIFPMNIYDDQINYQSGIMMSEAMKYAVAETNKNFTAITGYKLQITIFAENTTYDKPQNQILKDYLHGIPFVVGPYSSEQSYISNILTETLHLITVSYSATYIDFNKFDPIQSYMLRTVPSDVFRIEAAIDIITRLKWKSVDIVSSYRYDGQRDAHRFASKLSSIDVKLFNQIDLPKQPKKSDYWNAVTTFANDVNIDAVVMFTMKEDSRKFLQALQKKKLKKNFYLFCIYGCANYLEVVEGIKNVSSGMLSLDIHSPEIKGFKEYFLNLKPTVQSSHYFLKFWENIFKCSFANGTCTGKEELSEGKGYYPLTPVHTVINAVSVISEALTVLINRICHNKQRWMTGTVECLIDPKDTKMYVGHVYHVLQTLMTFKDDKATLKQSSQLLPKEDYVVRYDVHSYIPKDGYQHNVPIATWTFDRKGNNSEANLKMFHNWYVKEENVIQNNKYIVLKDNPVAVMFMILGLIGVCLTAGVVVFFVKYDHYIIIRHSGRDLCYMILLGISLLFLCQFVFLGKPSIPRCLLRSSLPGIAFLLCYAPLLFKINRMYRNFCYDKKYVSKSDRVNSNAVMLFSIGIILGQILLVGSRIILEASVPETSAYKNQKLVKMHCGRDSSPILLFCNVGSSVMFILYGTVLAFKMRQCANNCKEVKHVGITLYISCVAWLIFLITYFMVTDAGFLREYTLCGFAIAIGYITLFGLFGQKIHFLIWQQNFLMKNSDSATNEAAVSMNQITKI